MSQVRNRISFAAPLYTKKDHFTKPGSGQTLKHRENSKEMLFLTVTQSIREEDPGLWRDQNGAFHAIFHGPGHAWSADGLRWSLATDVDHPNTTKCHTEGDASGCGGPFQGTIKHADGSVQVLGDEERPKVWVNASR